MDVIEMEKLFKRINQRLVEYGRAYGSNFSQIQSYISKLGKYIDWHYNKNGVPQLNRSKSNYQAMENEQIARRVESLQSMREYHKDQKRRLSDELPNISTRELKDIIRTREEIKQRFDDKFSLFYGVQDQSKLISDFLNRDDGKPTYGEMEDLLNEYDRVIKEGVIFDQTTY